MVRSCSLYGIRPAHVRQEEGARSTPLGDEAPRNISLQLTPKVRLWIVGRLFAGVRFALVIRRGN